jgi:hypothetical protein
MHRIWAKHVTETPNFPNQSRPSRKFIMLIPGPKTTRQTIELFLRYDAQNGLRDLLSNVDFSSMKPSDVYRSIYGELPSSGGLPEANAEYYARDDFENQLLSNQFRANIINFFLDGYTEKQRIFFIHIPKCAGSDLTSHLMRRHIAIDNKMRFPHWMPSKELFLAIRSIAAKSESSDCFFVHGHARIDEYKNSNAIRSADKLITVVRNPTEIITSSINYILTRILNDQRIGRFAPDTADWLRVLNLDKLPDTPSQAHIAELSKRILRHTHTVRPNSMCYWLGRGDAQSALCNLIEHDVEITDSERYNTWLWQAWGEKSDGQQNKSRKFIATETFSPADLEYIETITREDTKLYTEIQNCLAEQNGSSIHGKQLAA